MTLLRAKQIMNVVSPSLKETVEAWCRERIKVYQASAEQIRIDANSVAAVTKDHVNRWLLELVQNAEDACATRVKVKVTASAIYFADDGRGLAGTSVRSISALHLSDKPAQAIGRKGLGFKAVYCVADEPAVFTGADGIQFSEEGARGFLAQHDFRDLAKMPYSWLPCWRARQHEEAADGDLKSLSEFRTVIRLPFRERATAGDAVAQARQLKAHTLLTFRHLRRIEIESVAASWVVEVEALGGDLWRVREDTVEQHWSVLVQREVETPATALVEFTDPDDRARCERASCLVATLLSEAGVPARFRPPPFLHVFYPTEIPAPLDILLHAEFVAKSDRTAIVPFSGSPFNAWLACVLAKRVVDFAQNASSLRQPEAGLLLLAPTQQTEEANSVTGALWERIVQAARERLLIPDNSGAPSLRLQQSVVLDLAMPGRTVARRVLWGSMWGVRLVHERIAWSLPTCPLRLLPRQRMSQQGRVLQVRWPRLQMRSETRQQEHRRLVSLKRRPGNQ